MKLVVKAGGALIKDSLETLLDSIQSIANRKDTRLILVHGGGVLVTEYSQKLGIEPRIVMHPSGMRSRYTSWEELQVFLMVMAGLINKNIVSGLISRGIQALGITGLDLCLVKAMRRKRIIILNEKGRKQVIPGGYTGKIMNVNETVLDNLLSASNTLILSPIACSEKGEPLNVDGDQMAKALAIALKADALVLLTDVPGVFVEDRVVERLTPGEARELASRIGPGMNRKLLMAAEAVESGVGLTVIGDGGRKDSIARLLDELEGTRIVPG